jgi:murein DD-endopeptidase MepM/ murein hydrolase activator NlpD
MKNKSTKFVIYKSSDKKIVFSLHNYILRFMMIFLISFSAYTAFTVYSYYSSIESLESMLSQKDTEIEGLKRENQLKEIENFELSTKISEKDILINSKSYEIEDKDKVMNLTVSQFEERYEFIRKKTQEMEKKLSELEDFKSFLLEYTGVSQGGSVSTSRAAGRAYTENSLNYESAFYSDEDFELEGFEELSYLYGRLDFIEASMEEGMEELVDIYDILQDRMDYLEAFPDFFPTVGRITSGFGYRVNPFSFIREHHFGVDIANAMNTDIMAAGKGVVVDSGFNYLYGRYLVIDHGYGFMTKYAHLYKASVALGDTVKKGQIIGKMGSTGQSTGSHLHFEVKVEGVAINPLNISSYFE